jgi:hypothetical protein
LEETALQAEQAATAVQLMVEVVHQAATEPLEGQAVAAVQQQAEQVEETTIVTRQH